MLLFYCVSDQVNAQESDPKLYKCMTDYEGNTTFKNVGGVA